MTTYIIRRVLWGIVVLFIVSLIVFFSLRLIPGDPVTIWAGQQAGSGGGMSEEMLDQLRVKYGLDKPVPIQYLNWVKGIFQGDLGESIRYKDDVGEILKQRLPVTLVLGLVATVISTVLGIFFGLLAAIRRGKWIDTLVTVLSYIGLCIPVFLAAFILMYVFALKLGWLPFIGYELPWNDFGKSLKQGVMPIICLAVTPLAVTARQMRSSVLEVNNMDYVRTAWSKGLREGRRHETRPQEQPHTGDHVAGHQHRHHLRRVGDSRAGLQYPRDGEDARGWHLPAGLRDHPGGHARHRLHDRCRQLDRGHIVWLVRPEDPL